MANIVENLKKILESRYGKDVRQAIHDSIYDINEIAETFEPAARAQADRAEQERIKAEEIREETETIKTEATTAATNAENSATEANGYVEIAQQTIGSGIATGEHVGLVKPDGTTITVDEDGTIHGSASVDIATTETVGVVKPDGTSITVDDDGTIHGSATVEIDAELSTESENAIMNKAVANALLNVPFLDDDDEEVEVADPRDADVLGGRIRAEHVEAIRDKVGTADVSSVAPDVSQAVVTLSQNLAGKTELKWMTIPNAPFNANGVCELSADHSSKKLNSACRPTGIPITIGKRSPNDVWMLYSSDYKNVNIDVTISYYE